MTESHILSMPEAGRATRIRMRRHGRTRARGTGRSGPAARVGVGSHLAGIGMLQNLVGPSRAKEIFFAARGFSAAEALAIGLVTEVIPADELVTRVRDTARRIADNAPLTVASVKRIVSELARPPEQRDLAAVNAAIAACFESEDYREGVAALLAKRKPRFS